MAQYDAIIVGAGLAGLAAALELLDAGKRVLLLDRDEVLRLGGLARESFGGMFFVGTPEQRRAGFRDSLERARADWFGFAEFGAGDAWPQAWAEAYLARHRAEVYDWVKASGVGFFPVPHWVERGGVTRGNTAPRFHLVWGTGRRLAEAVLARLDGHARRGRLELRCRHRVDGFVSEGGRVVGVRGEDEAGGRPFEARAGAVLIAAGGINGDLARVRRHWAADWGRPPESLLNGAHRYADGRLHDAAAAEGAVLTHLDWQWNYAAGVAHPRPAKPDHGLSLVPPRSGLWLDPQGRRIGPEPLVTGFDTHALVAAVCRAGGWSWLLCNRHIAEKELAVSGAEFNPSMRDRRPLAFLAEILFGNRRLVRELARDCADFLCADTLPELAARMNALVGGGVDPEALAAAVAAFDAEARRAQTSQDGQFVRLRELRRYRGDRLRLAFGQTLLDPKAGPLIAVRARIISRKSLGGLVTDLSSRVLDAAARPLPGLYAAGEAAGFGGGGIHGRRALEGTFLANCIFSGRIAGAAMARET